MSTFVLVHGLFLGAWCWERVVPTLREAGHVAKAIDLPGHGSDMTPTSEISMRLYVERIRRALTESSTRVTLVSHSASGIWASQAAELVPEAVERLIFVAAVIPQDGESLMDWTPRAPTSLTVQRMVADRAAGLVSLDPLVAADALFEDCLPQDMWGAVRRMTPSPIAPLSAPVKLTACRFGRIPRSYVRCERDRSIPPDTQTQICELSPCETVRSMDTGHAPFYAAPAQLAHALAQLAAPALTS